MNIFVGIVLILGSIGYGFQAKRNFYKEQNRWTAFGLSACVVGFFFGVCILVGIIDLTPLFSK